MKKLLFSGLTLLVILLSGCAEELDFQSVNSTQSDLSTVKTGTINEDEAIAIASKVLGRDLTRGGSEAAVKCDYVFRKDSPVRIEDLPDTLAYVINYTDKKGFVIVAGDRRVNPVLAYSNEGSFSFENEAVVDCFISKIGCYLASRNSTKQNSGDDLNIVGPGQKLHKSILPPTKTLISQISPWDKYVQEEHPRSHTGCVPVATVLMMLHSQRKFYYHGETYYSISIIRPLSGGLVSYGNTVEPQVTIEPPITFDPIYSYQQAEDAVAKLLYWVGKDVGAEYKPDETTTAKSINAYNFLNTNGFPLATPYSTFESTDVVENLLANNYIYVDGRSLKPEPGHAWIISGCEYDYYENLPNKYLNVMFYCDWGWGDSMANGYYSGEVFSGVGNEGTFEFAFKPTVFFAIKREWSKPL